MNSAMLSRQGPWVIGALLLALTVAGCPDADLEMAAVPEPPPQVPFVSAPLPPTSDALFGRAWTPTVPSAAMATLTLNADGSGEHGQFLLGRSEPSRVAARWERTEAGLRLTVEGKTTTYFDLRYGTQAGEPRLLWDGRTYHRAISGAGFEKYDNPKGEVLLRLAEGLPEPTRPGSR